MYIDKFKKIVIKIGSSILIDEKGKPKKIWLQEFTKDIHNLIKKKKKIFTISALKHIGLKTIKRILVSYVH